MTDASEQANTKFFEAKIRPLLADTCQRCHGPKRHENDLRLDSREAILKGGKSGPAVVPGQPEKSLLLDAVRHTGAIQMPPKKKLTIRQIADLTSWVRLGAPWPGQSASVRPVQESARAYTEAERNFWAFQRPVAQRVPTVRDQHWSRTAIDNFVLARLEASGLKPAPSADKRTLLRRITFDLVGLPPTLEEMTAFLRDDSPGAYAAVVERLLTSPHYGERWGRRFLDVARYADSNGMDDNLAHADAWRYRDYVVAAFNRDKPYNQFVREQIAGDLLAGWNDPRRAEFLTATGFLMIGPKMVAEDDPVKQQLDIVDEQLDTIGRAFLGLTLGCARCHDHKFDPITMADYYGLAGIFFGTRTMLSHRVDAKWNAVALAGKTADDRLSKAEADADFHDNVLINGATQKLTAEEKKKHEQARAKALADYQAIAKAMAPADGPGKDLPLLYRGNHLTPGPIIPRRFPVILAGENQNRLGSAESGRRELADWLTRPDHPLTARVVVNRVWQAHFGHGLVRSADNFGRLGDRPDNQALLDWLAQELINSGWSIKTLHRLILHSSTYQMSSGSNPTIDTLDPDNRLLGRANRRRMEAEVLRDALLALAGKLDRQPGGPAMAYPCFENLSLGGKSRNKANYESSRRSIYLPVLRSALFDVFQTFDFPDPAVSSGQRLTTVVPSQALFLMNSSFVDECCTGVAARLAGRSKRQDPEVLASLYETILGRPPRPDEIDAWSSYARAYRQIAPANSLWPSICRLLVSSNEFVYIE